MFTQYLPPSKWWRREIRVKVTIWPKWLAQTLCNHENIRAFGWDKEFTHSVCSDCNKQFTKPNTCKHPMKQWVVDAQTRQPTPLGGGSQLVPTAWHCGDCGRPFTRDEFCPECHVPMEITEYMDMFSGRFHCSECSQYYFREDL